MARYVCISLLHLTYILVVIEQVRALATINHGHLNFSSADPHIFSSLFGLAQQWPNTFFPFGHAIVPCEIPINTNLYHARIDADLPPSPEWFALDAEMSYAIAGAWNNSHLLTYRTTRNVKCIYFDGASAALDASGNMDSQMVLIYNNSANVPDNPPFGPQPGNPTNHTSGDPNGSFLGAEYDRAYKLCAHIRSKGLGGRGWGFEGIIRMNAGFEVIWCDFKSPSVQLISHFNVGVPTTETDNDERETLMEANPAAQHAMLLDRRPPRPPGRSTFGVGAQWGWLTASTKQYGFAGGMPGRGEARILIDSCGMFTFYDPALQDQEDARIMQDRVRLNLTIDGTWKSPLDSQKREIGLQILSRRRRVHRATNISISDSKHMHSTIEQSLRDSLDTDRSQCGGIDWHEVGRDIVLTYAPVLQDLKAIISTINVTNGSDPKAFRRQLQPIREMSHQLMMPYYEYPSGLTTKSPIEREFAPHSRRSEEAFQRCKTQHEPLVTSSLSRFEKLAIRVIDSILGEICSVILETFLDVEAGWFLSYREHTVMPNVDFNHHKMKLEELMAWLGWADQWTSCKPGCGIAEICWIPMWPVSFMLSLSPNQTHGPPGPPPPYDDRYRNGTWPGGPPSGPYRGRYGGPPGDRFHQDDTLLWQPRCVNRVELLQNLTEYA